MRVSHLGLGLLALACSGTVRTGVPDTSAGCTKDTDCKGDRICAAGRCTAPGDGGGSGGSGGGSSSTVDGAAPIGTGGVFGGCSGQKFDAPPLPVDAYVMFDQSSSMSDPVPGSNPTKTWWQEAQDGVTTFVNDPRAAGSPGHAAVTVGIQFFPLNGIAPQSCMADYKTPEVELGLLPGNAAAIAAAMQKHQPTAFTPTTPALVGAIAHMKEWAPKHPDHAPVVVLVTDGFPTECDPQDVIDIAALVQNAYQTEPKVRTFVVGLNFQSGGSNLDMISEAGGTGTPILINDGDIGSQLVEAMLGISNTTLQCKFGLPPAPAGQTLDPARVEVTFTPSATMVETQIPKLIGQSECALNMNEGWFYDSYSKPTQILVCPGTCSKLIAGVVKTQVGCYPIVGSH